MATATSFPDAAAGGAPGPARRRDLGGSVVDERCRRLSIRT
ncbi:hypothetical protein C731_0222 [Mycolicibacterium hassiacum DSM 44199]|uniref:Uncharacterized protein n=1 Tax=Mycolicibacterium hassiacum (strain DSM 44199 / CIP 105218 / JCM 12690 / 3849) TaxID=1122247 RepID=K5BKZ7_MYCHD|nr:hypothetical protein C731_0222 [Mycolicibacterium hassiacum DSM 44199]